MFQFPRRTPRPASWRALASRRIVTSAPALAAPEVAGLALWLDAAALPQVGGSTVASWPDRSGQGRTATSGGLGPSPTFQVGAFGPSQGAVLFQEQAELTLGGPALVLGGPSALFCVVDRLPGSSYFAVNPRTDLPNYTGLALLGSDQIVVCDDDANYGLISYSGTGPLMLRWLRDGSGWTFRGTGMTADETIVSQDVTGNPPAATGPLTVQSLIHRQTVPQDGGDVQLAELMLYDEAVSATDREALESYLAAKWGVTP